MRGEETWKAARVLPDRMSDSRISDNRVLEVMALDGCVEVLSVLVKSAKWLHASLC